MRQILILSRLALKRISHGLLFLVLSLSAETKTDREVFGTWIDAQRVYDDYHLALSTQAGDFLTPVKPRYGTHQLFAPTMPNESLDLLIAQYNKVARQALHLSKKREEQMLALANYCFSFCFGAPSYQKFYAMINDSMQHGYVRLLYAVMWEHFVGRGWKDWHSVCLAALRAQADQGKRIVYIAGGNDIYQLLAHGIYNIDVIDPLLPSQPKYYAGGWLWLVKKNGIGDKIVLNQLHLMLRRLQHVDGALFPARLSTGQHVLLQASITAWGVFDHATGKQLGAVVFKRRFARDDDFVMNDKQELLMSFNEFFFVNAPSALGGWGIHLDQVPATQPWFVKQLCAPLTVATIGRIRSVDRVPFSFILLGSCAT